MTQKFNCIAIDDEPLALQLVESYIRRTPFLNLIGTYGSAEEAMSTIQNEKIDVAFLDIQMPDFSGLQVSKMLSPDTKVVFVTAHDRFAIEGYKVNAVGYLLKPISYDEFLDVAMKVQGMLQKEQVAAAPVAAAPSQPEQKTILVKSDYKMLQIPIKDILYIEGLKDYVKIYLENEKDPIVSLLCMKSLESKLPENKFCRVHRSFIVQTSKCKIIEKGRIVIENNSIPISDSYRSAFFDKLQNVAIEV
ncbi:MAG: response regulator transcription factor [Bacteroidales bacterium]|nr:response regulator transcription factor [Candidatus Scybalocola fimicaballi]